MAGLGQAILVTLAYRDVFDFPLTEKEIWQGLVGRGDFKRASLRKNLKLLTGRALIGCRGGYYYLSGREKIVDGRRRRAVESKIKWRLAKRVGRVLRFLPGVWGVYVTGSVAQQNAKTEDDIDLLIITSPDGLWWARAWVWLILGLIHRRRKPGETKVKNLFCPNLFLAADQLQIDKKRRNLFTAHELAAARLVWVHPWLGKAPLLVANPWVDHFFGQLSVGGEEENLIRSRRRVLCGWWNSFFYFTQRCYMKRRLSSEEVGFGRAFFHPQDASRWVKKAFFKRLERLQIEPGLFWLGE